jgi:murein DD-endopeptidase MepM/ murein hydrolase activator NlpD
MTRSYRLIVTLLFILLNAHFAQAQQSKPVTISVETNSDGEPTFYANNTSSIPYTVSISFSNIQNSIPPSPNPYLKTVKTGRSKILTLEKSGISDRGVRYRYRYSYSLGCYNTEPDTELEYLLPIANKKTTTVFDLYYIVELVNEEEPDGFYSLGFTAKSGDLVFASRGGTVTDVVDEFDNSEVEKYFSSNYNYVRVVHDDCTFGSYRHLKKGSIAVQPGDEIYAGSPIGKVVPRDTPEGARFRFMLNYKNDDYVQGGEEDYWNYLVPKFRTKTAKKTQLQPNSEYTSTHPVDLITQEMGWFERRRWKRKNK